MIEWLDIEATRKGNAVYLTAFGPDDEQRTVKVDSPEIRAHFSLSAAAFFEQYSDNKDILFSLFNNIQNQKNEQESSN